MRGDPETGKRSSGTLTGLFDVCRLPHHGTDPCLSLTACAGNKATGDAVAAGKSVKQFAQLDDGVCSGFSQTIVGAEFKETTAGETVVATRVLPKSKM
jgi:hypothetical protein